tara:strand:- start:65 stop:592 length:528 start_codon:yes stop_codon:yes gene_type:complete
MEYTCKCCGKTKSADEFDFIGSGEFKYPLPICKDCSDEHWIEDIDCSCSVCKRKLPFYYFGHYRTRFKKNGMRLRVNTNCRDCSKKESAVLAKIKKDNPPPAYLTPCPQCGKIVYEKSEDIPEGVDGTNGPWQCDHDHKTGTFRRYCCKKCNVGTGLIGDNEECWTNAQQYKKSK